MKNKYIYLFITVVGVIQLVYFMVTYSPEQTASIFGISVSTITYNIIWLIITVSSAYFYFTKNKSKS